MSLLRLRVGYMEQFFKTLSKADKIPRFCSYSPLVNLVIHYVPQFQTGQAIQGNFLRRSSGLLRQLQWLHLPSHRLFRPQLRGLQHRPWHLPHGQAPLHGKVVRPCHEEWLWLLGHWRDVPGALLRPEVLPGDGGVQQGAGRGEEGQEEGEAESHWWRFRGYITRKNKVKDIFRFASFG